MALPTYPWCNWWWSGAQWWLCHPLESVDHSWPTPEKVTLRWSPGWGGPQPSCREEKAGAVSVWGADTMADRKTHIHGGGRGWGWPGPALPELPKPRRRGCPGLQQKPTLGFPHPLPFWESPFLPLSVDACPHSEPSLDFWVQWRVCCGQVWGGASLKRLWLVWSQTRI